MTSSSLRHKRVVDGARRLALASPFVTRLPGREERTGCTSLNLRRRSGPALSLLTGGIARAVRGPGKRQAFGWEAAAAGERPGALFGGA